MADNSDLPIPHIIPGTGMSCLIAAGHDEEEGPACVRVPVHDNPWGLEGGVECGECPTKQAIRSLAGRTVVEVAEKVHVPYLVSTG